MTDTAKWEYIDIVYSETEAGHLKGNLERSGKVVLVEPQRKPNELPSWWVWVARK